MPALLIQLSSQNSRFTFCYQYRVCSQLPYAVWLLSSLQRKYLEPFSWGCLTLTRSHMHVQIWMSLFTASPLIPSFVEIIVLLFIQSFHRIPFSLDWISMVSQTTPPILFVFVSFNWLGNHILQSCGFTIIVFRWTGGFYTCIIASLLYCAIECLFLPFYLIKSIAKMNSDTHRNQ